MSSLLKLCLDSLERKYWLPFDQVIVPDDGSMLPTKLKSVSVSVIAAIWHVTKGTECQMIIGTAILSQSKGPCKEGSPRSSNMASYANLPETITRKVVDWPGGAALMTAVKIERSVHVKFYKW